jgi:hypothetical protein
VDPSRATRRWIRPVGKGTPRSLRRVVSKRNRKEGGVEKYKLRGEGRRGGGSVGRGRGEERVGMGGG